MLRARLTVLVLAQSFLVQGLLPRLNLAFGLVGGDSPLTKDSPESACASRELIHRLAPSNGVIAGSLCEIRDPLVYLPHGLPQIGVLWPPAFGTPESIRF